MNIGKIPVPEYYKTIFLAFLVLSLGDYFYSDVFLKLKSRKILATTTLAPSDYQSIKMAQIDHPLLIPSSGETFKIPTETLSSWIENYDRAYTQRQELRPNLAKITDYLSAIAQKLDRQPVNAKLDYRDGKIVEFSFPQNGLSLNIGKTSANISAAMFSGSDRAGLVFDVIEPAITLEKINNLGITGILGHGESDFTGSSADRIHNIKISAKLFNGVLIGPGEKFSFNQILGLVDGSTGYRQEFVIKNHTVLKEFGGGVCQVSTTAFRAAILAGLPILERHPHAIPVHYYNPQGFDATVYPGSADLQFQNDTANNILIQTKISGTKIYFDLYGATDGRKVSMSEPTIYESDPDGSMKTIFTRTIEYADGKTKTEKFRSAYKSPEKFPTLRNPLE